MFLRLPRRFSCRLVRQCIGLWLCACVGLLPGLSRATSAVGTGGNWILLASDGSSSQFISTAATDGAPSGEARAQVKTVFRSAKDMMGLSYNASLTTYRLSCASAQVLSRQRFLLDDDLVVWTFPEVTDAQSARRELSESALNVICPTGADRAD